MAELRQRLKAMLSRGDFERKNSRFGSVLLITTRETRRNEGKKQSLIFLDKTPTKSRAEQRKIMQSLKKCSVAILDSSLG